MPTNLGPLRGVVHGKTIELVQHTGILDGREVLVTVKPIGVQEKRFPPGEGLRRSAGAWADAGEDLDEFLEWNRQQRKIDRPPIEE